MSSLGEEELLLLVHVTDVCTAALIARRKNLNISLLSKNGFENTKGYFVGEIKTVVRSILYPEVGDAIYRREVLENPQIPRECDEIELKIIRSLTAILTGKGG